jgi:hypothetical protein
MMLLIVMINDMSFPELHTKDELKKFHYTNGEQIRH